MSTPSIRLLAAFVVVAIAAPLARADTHFHNDAAHFSIDVPDNWRDTTASERQDKSVSEKRGGRFVAVYRAGVAMPELEVQILAGRLTVNGVADRLNYEFKEEQRASANPFTGQFNVSIDEAHHRVITTIIPTLVGPDSYRVISYAYPGEMNTIQLRFYDYPGPFAEHEGQMRQIADSFKYDASFGYPDYAGAVVADRQMLWMTSAVSVAVAALLLWIVWSIHRGRQRKLATEVEKSRQIAASAAPTPLAVAARKAAGLDPLQVDSSHLDEPESEGSDDSPPQ